MSFPCCKNPQFLGSTFSCLEKQKGPFSGQKFCKIATLQAWKHIFWYKVDCNLPFLADNIDSTSRDYLSLERQWQSKLFLVILCTLLGWFNRIHFLLPRNSIDILEDLEVVIPEHNPHVASK
jgi:hypothetical protein